MTDRTVSSCLVMSQLVVLFHTPLVLSKYFQPFTSVWYCQFFIILATYHIDLVMALSLEIVCIDE